MSESIERFRVDSGALYNDIISALEEGCGESLYPGDERRIFGEALVPILMAVYESMHERAKWKMLRYATGDVLDALGERLRVSRAEAEPGEVVLKFSLEGILDDTIIIPHGTRATDGSLVFATDTQAVILPGEKTVQVTAHTTTNGADTNGVTIGAVSKLVDLIPYVAAVQNMDVSHGGDDGEPYTREGDDHYRERIRTAGNAVSTAGPEAAYRYHVLNADSRIIDAYIHSPSACVVTIMPLLAGGEIPDETMLQKVRDALAADGVRPMTDKVDVFAPSPVPYDIVLTYYTTQEDAGDCAENILRGVQDFVEYTASALGCDIDPDHLKKYLLSARDEEGTVLPGALRVSVESPVFTTLQSTEIGRHSGVLSISRVVV